MPDWAGQFRQSPSSGFDLPGILYKNLDGGKTWKEIENSPERILSLWLSPQKLYIGTEKGLFVSQTS